MYSISPPLKSFPSILMNLFLVIHTTTDIHTETDRHTPRYTYTHTFKYEIHISDKTCRFVLFEPSLFCLIFNFMFSKICHDLIFLLKFHNIIFSLSIHLSIDWFYFLVIMHTTPIHMAVQVSMVGWCIPFGYKQKLSSMTALVSWVLRSLKPASTAAVPVHIFSSRVWSLFSGAAAFVISLDNSPHIVRETGHLL